MNRQDFTSFQGKVKQFIAGSPKANCRSLIPVCLAKRRQATALVAALSVLLARKKVGRRRVNPAMGR